MIKIKKYVDLSWELTESTPIYPGDPVPKIETATTLENDGYNLSGVYMGTQTGTHVDAPYHFSDMGETIDKMELDFFFGPALLIPVLGKKEEEPITSEDFGPYLKRLSECSIVLVRTDWYKKAGTKAFFRHPYVSAALAERMVASGVRLLCIDTINADRTGGRDFPVHELFAEKRLMIGENMAFFDQIDFENILLTAFPLKLKGCDGSPVRAVAMEAEVDVP